MLIIFLFFFFKSYLFISVLLNFSVISSWGQLH